MCQKERHGISKGNHINYGLLSNYNGAPGRSLNLNLLMGKYVSNLLKANDKDLHVFFTI